MNDDVIFSSYSPQWLLGVTATVGVTYEGWGKLLLSVQWFLMFWSCIEIGRSGPAVVGSGWRTLIWVVIDVPSSSNMQISHTNQLIGVHVFVLYFQSCCKCLPVEEASSCICYYRNLKWWTDWFVIMNLYVSFIFTVAYHINSKACLIIT